MSGYDGTKASGTLLCQYVRTGAPVAAHSRRFARPLNKIQWQIRGAVRDGNLVVNIQSNKGYPVFSRSPSRGAGTERVNQVTFLDLTR